MMTGKLLMVLICCIFFLLLSLYYDKDMRRTKHKHEYKKVLYYTCNNEDSITLRSEERCSCGKSKNYKYITSKYYSTCLEKVSIVKHIKVLGYAPIEEVEADLIAPLDWIKEE